MAAAITDVLRATTPAMESSTGFQAYRRSITGALRSNYSFGPRSLAEEERDRVEGGGKKFKRTLSYFQLICLGVGGASQMPIFLPTS